MTSKTARNTTSTTSGTTSSPSASQGASLEHEGGEGEEPPFPVAEQLHGSLVEVAGLGVLILGPSGIGKSECVIELVRRGQRLVADDVVRLGIDEGGRVIGWSPPQIRHFIEVRGLGLLCVADLFGPHATLESCEVHFIVRLEELGRGNQFERIGLEREHESLAGRSIPVVRLPVHAASNLATLVELAIRDWQLRCEGDERGEAAR